MLDDKTRALLGDREPLTMEQLRKMDGQPVWENYDAEMWGDE